MSIVENKCDLATNNLQVIYNPLKDGQEKKKFAICVKALDFLDIDLSVRLVEWIELLTILGADKVIIFYLKQNLNMLSKKKECAKSNF